MEIKKLIPALLAGLALSGAAQAALVNNGGGLIYDTDLNVTWLQDANLAASNNFGVAGVNADGSMTGWTTAIDYIAAMNAASYLGHSDWRLPTVTDTGTPGCQSIVADGTDDCGYNIHTSEMGHLFYVELGGTGDYDTAGNPQTASLNPGPFINIQRSSTAAYWSGTVYPTATGYAWVFDFTGGLQYPFDKTTNNFYVWAVLPGDVSVNGNNSNPVPEPEAWLMMLAGLGLVGAVARRRRA